MQKLITIYLDNMAYDGMTMLKGHANRHGQAEEHLKELLADGWWIVSTCSMGGAADGYSARGWLAVVLERNEP
jgi:hypothetical protein